MIDRVSEVLDIVRRVCSLGEYDSNVIGMAAEIIAEDIFRMEKWSRGSKSIDGLWTKDNLGRTVQVKAWSENRVKRYRMGTMLRTNAISSPDDLLLILIFTSKAEYQVLYNGPTNSVGYVETSGLTRLIKLKDLNPDFDLNLLN